MASDAFTNSSGTDLPTHDSNYEDIDSSYNADDFEIQSNHVEIYANWRDAGAIRTDSSEDSSQIKMLGGSDEDVDVRRVCVRADNADGGGASRGYSVAFAGGDGTEWDLVTIAKNGGWFAALSKSGTTWLMGNDHDVRIWCSGTSTVTIHASVDDDEMDSTTADSSSPIGVAHPGFWGDDTSDAANNSGMDDWTDGVSATVSAFPAWKRNFKHYLRR